MPYLLILAALVLGYFAWRAIRRRRTRRVLLNRPLSDHERQIIAQMVPMTRKLPPALRNSFEGKVNLFLHQIDFIGCDGLDVTDEMELSIAAQACLLVVNSTAWYDTLRTVLIYPGAFRAIQRDHDGFVVTEHDSIRLGESWARGPVVLSWADSHRGAQNSSDGHNLVIHEFAHQLDGLSGHTDGAPLMEDGQDFTEWERVILAAFDRHLDNTEQGRKTVLDAYGATNHEEFFAVAVEVFFEKPVALRDEEPEVYDQLTQLFRLDPAGWQ